jgi:polysaccharide biosynthesis/export protein
MSKRFMHMAKAIKLVYLMVLVSTMALAQDANQRYVLRAGDEITVQYRYTPEFDQTVKVQPDGFVALEIVGDIKLGGQTIGQARDMIIEKAKVRLKDPEVSLSLKEFEKPFFVVAGEVIKPGKFDLHKEVTALQAIMLAGGFKDQAKASQVIVFRRVESGLSETHVLNFSQASRKGGKFQDLPLQTGDMLMIPQNTITRLERYMKVANVGLFFNPLQWLF